VKKCLEFRRLPKVVRAFSGAEGYRFESYQGYLTEPLRRTQLSVPSEWSEVRPETLKARKTSAEGCRMSRRTSVPSYRLHRQSGQAVVTLTDGFGGRHDVLLGKHGTQESRVEYARVIAEWEALGRRLPTKPEKCAVTVNELLLAYWQFAEGYQRQYPGNCFHVTARA
jgi:hypothetical protein